MAVWKDLRSASIPDGMSSSIDMEKDRANYEVRQDVSAYLEQAKKDRETTGMKRGHLKKFATIPDVVAIEILSKYGMDIHDPAFMHDPDNMKKFKYIIETEYKNLMAY